MVENENIKKILYMGVGRSGLENESSIIAKALSELMEYRAIGTIDEFKSLKEKNEPKKPIEETDNDGYVEYYCPNCEAHLFFDEDQKFCNECGQAIDCQ